jgi:DNA polymerase III epsilon subunit-like protein
MRFEIADTETTGLSEPMGVCEIGMIEIDSQLNVISEFDALVNPLIPIEPGASGVHGIRDSQVADEPTIDKIAFPDGEVCLICHNVKFDRPLLADHMNIVAQCDTLILARRLLPDCPDHKLGTLAAYIDLQQQLSHRALYDCRWVLGLLEYLVEGSGMNLIQLVNYSNTPQRLSVMPWGKHAGKKFSELPYSYIHWLKGLDDLDIDMQLSIKLY